ncbi:MAG: hypothetical protein RPU59_14570, partial [Candidatus Sedimenticola sp. (ex Thyasira tokunagai)]
AEVCSQILIPGKQCRFGGGVGPDVGVKVFRELGIAIDEVHGVSFAFIGQDSTTAKVRESSLFAGGGWKLKQRGQFELPFQY